MNSEPTTTREKFHVEQLLLATAFPHEITRPRIIETHISWIVLTGEFAYKIKKPVQFDFVDYSTLAKRQFNCEKEVALNRRYASDIYLGVVPIYDLDGQYLVGEILTDQKPQWEPVEFAVKMKEFSQDSILANQLKTSHLPSGSMDRFAADLAAFHRRVPAESVEDLEQELARIHGEVTDNFVLLRKSLANTPQAETINRIEEWSESQFDLLSERIQVRIKAGHLKKCHGDLHLNNIILFEDRLVPFDGIEFNEHLQTIDTLNEVAFPLMDLIANEFRPHAWRFLNTYLEDTNQYHDLNLLRFFSVYRAMVRAKVAWIHCQVKSSTSGHHSSWLKGDLGKDVSKQEPQHPWDHYLEFAVETIATSKPKLCITFGFSGSGKSTQAIQFVEDHGAIRLRSDVRRMEIKQQDTATRLYAPETTDRIYRKLLDDAKSILTAGYSVVVDATFLAQHHRQWFQELAAGLQCEFHILACDANFGELCTRIRERTGDPSEATIAVLQQQMESYDPLNEAEKQATLELTQN